MSIEYKFGLSGDEEVFSHVIKYCNARDIDVKLMVEKLQQCDQLVIDYIVLATLTKIAYAEFVQSHGFNSNYVLTELNNSIKKLTER